jgi:hypothetical protein
MNSNSNSLAFALTKAEALNGLPINLSIPLLAILQEILDRVVDLLDSSVAELVQAKKTIEKQALTIQELQQQLQETVKGRLSGNTADITKTQGNAGTRKEEDVRQPPQLPLSTSAAAAVPAVLAAIETSSSSNSNSGISDTKKPTSISGFDKLTVDLHELEDFITGGTNIAIDSDNTTAGRTTQQPIITPVSARDRIAAFEKASREAMLLQQRDMMGNKLPELAPQCKITAAARAGSGNGIGGGKGKKKKGKPTP